MPPARSLRVASRALVLLAGLAAAAIGPPALAASATRDVRLGDEVETTVAPGDVHTYRIDLVAGASLRVRARLGEGSTAPVTLTLRRPDGGTVDVRSGDDVRIETTAATAGVHRVEVTSPSGTSAYEIEFTGSSPSHGGGAVAGPGTFHVAPPRGATVRIDVRRRSGARPEVTAVRDGTGRSLAFRVARSQRSLVRLAPLPVSGPGGLDVEVRGAGGADGTYDVRYRVLDEDDDGPAGGGDEDRAPRRLVLALAAGADPQTVADALGYELKDVGDGFIVVETQSEGTEVEDAADADDRSDDVLGAEPDSYLHAPEGTQTNHVVIGSDLGRADVTNQPAMDQVRAVLAQRRATGAGVTVAVLDTGADLAHELLAGRLVAGWDFVDGDDTPAEETNGLDDDGDLEIDEGFGHGTFVAGLVATVAPEAQVMPVRVLDTDARGTVSGIAAGIEWAVAHGADVINLSLGMDTRSGVVGDAVRYALARGVVVVAATGNGGQPAAVSFPATVNGVVAVTATDPATQGPAAFANGGPAATVAAPGSAIVGPVPGGAYGTWSGTSFSAGIASGGAALLVQARPALAPAQVAARFRATARPAPASVPRAQRRRLGGGRLDLWRLLR